MRSVRRIPTLPGNALRVLLSLAEPAALAIAAACGAGVFTQFALDAALRMARHALSA